MLNSLKLWNLKSAVQNRRKLEEAFTAVVELGRIGNDKAVEILIEALGRKDQVARSAARELGRLGKARAAQPLADLLEHPDVCQSAAEALQHMGASAVDPVVRVLRSESSEARRLAAATLGELEDKRAVEPLVEVLSHDGDYAVRTAAATALGQIKDQRAVWVLVGTLKLSGETDPERRQALENLQKAASGAMRKIGDPLAMPKASGHATLAEQAAELEEEAEREAMVHPRLLGDFSSLSDHELVVVLKELVGASEEISWAKLENREPMLPAYFKSYEQRRETAEIVGRELHRRGGTERMKEVWKDKLDSYASIQNWWSGIGGWTS